MERAFNPLIRILKGGIESGARGEEEGRGKIHKTRHNTHTHSRHHHDRHYDSRHSTLCSRSLSLSQSPAPPHYTYYFCGFIRIMHYIRVRLLRVARVRDTTSEKGVGRSTVGRPPPPSHSQEDVRPFLPVGAAAGCCSDGRLIRTPRFCTDASAMSKDSAFWVGTCFGVYV